MQFKRTGGILLHPTSLPGNHGIGELGDEALKFIDFMVKTGSTLWQIFPLGPTGFGDSPYQCLSAFAGNPLLISLSELIKENLLTHNDIGYLEQNNPAKIDFGNLIPWKIKILELSFFNYFKKSSSIKKEFEKFCQAHKSWLEDYSIFMALKKKNGGKAWIEWEEKYKNYDKFNRTAFLKENSDEVDFYNYTQFLFFKQWTKVKKYAEKNKIEIIGDIPIFVAYDSADVWSNQNQFWLDKSLNLVYKAGVPPDYFSETGQMWGNPHYRWDVMEKDKFSWWIKRFETMYQMVDIVRLDHFRGFEAYWQIPGKEKTAVKGKWVKGPGHKFFNALKNHFGKLPIIAEDLGVITKEVEKLRDEFEFPGMKILQFAFDSDASADFLPHNYKKNCVVYTGSHDNDTTIGWYKQFMVDFPEKAETVKKYTNTNGWEINWILIRLALASVADFAIIPMQDLIGLDKEGRMNFPGKPYDNWQWRYTEAQLNDVTALRFKELLSLYGRIEIPKKPVKKS